MKKEIAKKWVEALRSGDYTQEKAQLRGFKGFCCLGVLCNIHAQEHPEIAKKELNPGMYLGSAYILPKEVMKWAGLSTEAGEKRDRTNLNINGETYTHLAHANDKGVTFEGIAKWIEKNYKEL